MQNNVLLSEEHQEYLAGYEQYLRVLGYQESKNHKGCIKEFLSRMEAQGKSLASIDKSDMQAHYQYLLERPNKCRSGALSLYTIRGYLFKLRLFFTYAEKIDLIPINPMSSLVYPSQPKSQRTALTRKEISRLYAACETPQDKALLGLFYGCGLRRSEAEHLDLRDLDFKGLCLYVRSGKGKRRRVVPLSEQVAQALKAYRYEQRPQAETNQTKGKDGQAFMLNKRGTRVRGNTYHRYFKKLVERSGLSEHISVHHLRHSIATHLLSSGMGLESVRDFLGHQFLETTQIYTHISWEDLKMQD